MKERIQITTDYEIEYEGIQGREAAIEAALEGGIEVRGAGPGGCYAATQLGVAMTSAAEMRIPMQESLL